MCCNLLATIIRAQHISFDGLLYKALTGIGTGLACGVFLANIMLNDFDEFMVQRSRVEFYTRFVDDILVIDDKHTSADLVAYANDWHASIQLEATSCDRSNVAYLDLSLSLDSSGNVSYDLYRKPLNKYFYLPRSSCHPCKVFSSIIRGEATRILRRCSFLTRAFVHLGFFQSKLLDRGYSLTEIRQQFDIAILRHKQYIRNNKRRAGGNGIRKGFLKITHSASVDYSCLAKALHGHSHLLNSSIVCASTIQQSVFRMLYPYMWK